ncbi:MAG: RCC1 domain-containing protein, partial [Rhodanobacter sp.]
MGVTNGGLQGDGLTEVRPGALSVMTETVDVEAGVHHSLIVQSDGTLWATGANWDGTTATQSTPVWIANGVAAASAGQNHTLYVKTDGTLWAMGANWYGQLGDGTTSHSSTPVQVASGVASVSAGGNHTLYVKTDGTLWAMGDNSSGQLGDGSATQRTTPVQVASGVASVSAGLYHTLYVKTDGTLWAMGDNSYGQLGDETTTDRFTPVQVASGVASVSAGFFHTLYVKTDGTLWAMGYNGSGQLGDGTSTQRLTPVQVASRAASVSAGNSHTLYVKTDGTLWAMGDNWSGQLGDGTRTTRFTPVQVASGVTVASAGDSHSLWIESNEPPPPSFTVSPLPKTVDQGSSVTLSALAEGPETITYQWRKDGVDLTGETTPELTLTDVQLADAGTYDVVATNGSGSTVSNAAMLTVLLPVLQQPQSVAATIGDDVVLSIAVDGTGVTYQWRRNGYDIAGATGSSLLLSSIVMTDADRYDVVITHPSSGLEQVSEAANVQVYPAVLPGHVTVAPDWRVELIKDTANIDGVIPTADGGAWVTGSFIEIDNHETYHIAKFTDAFEVDTSFRIAREIGVKLSWGGFALQAGQLLVAARSQGQYGTSGT